MKNNFNPNKLHGCDQFIYSVWIKRGDMIVDRSSLDFDDSESLWALWWDQYKEVIPTSGCVQIWGCDISNEDRKTLESFFFEQDLKEKEIMGCFITD